MTLDSSTTTATSCAGWSTTADARRPGRQTFAWDGRDDAAGSRPTASTACASGCATRAARSCCRVDDPPRHHAAAAGGDRARLGERAGPAVFPPRRHARRSASGSPARCSGARVPRLPHRRRAPRVAALPGGAPGASDGALGRASSTAARAAPGTYAIVARVRDRAGNVGPVRTRSHARARRGPLPGRAGRHRALRSPAQAPLAPVRGGRAGRRVFVDARGGRYRWSCRRAAPPRAVERGSAHAATALRVRAPGGALGRLPARASQTAGRTRRASPLAVQARDGAARSWSCCPRSPGRGATRSTTTATACPNTLDARRPRRSRARSRATALPPGFASHEGAAADASSTARGALRPHDRPRARCAGRPGPLLGAPPRRRPRRRRALAAADARRRGCAATCERGGAVAVARAPTRCARSVRLTRRGGSSTRAPPARRRRVRLAARAGPARDRPAARVPERRRSACSRALTGCSARLRRARGSRASPGGATLAAGGGHERGPAGDRRATRSAAAWSSAPGCRAGARELDDDPTARPARRGACGRSCRGGSVTLEAIGVIVVALLAARGDARAAQPRARACGDARRARAHAGPAASATSGTRRSSSRCATGRRCRRPRRRVGVAPWSLGAGALVRRRPRLLPLAAVAAVPFRVPIESGGETANLLVPLYFVDRARASLRLRAARARCAATAGAAASAEPGAAGAGRAAARRRVVLYAVQAAYSTRLQHGARAGRLLLRPVRAAVRAAARGARGRRALAVRCLAVLVGARARASPAVGFVEYATRDVLLNPKVDRLEPVPVLLPGQLAVLRPEHLRALPRRRDGRCWPRWCCGASARRACSLRRRVLAVLLRRPRADALAVELRRAARRPRRARRAALEPAAGRRRRRRAGRDRRRRGRRARPGACGVDLGRGKLNKTTSGRVDLRRGRRSSCSRDRPVCGLGLGRVRGGVPRAGEVLARRAPRPPRTRSRSRSPPSRA